MNYLSPVSQETRSVTVVRVIPNIRQISNLPSLPLDSISPFASEQVMHVIIHDEVSRSRKAINYLVNLHRLLGKSTEKYNTAVGVGANS